jgi:ubiquinone/menaquinone biosynthesis C-methylase UbiE
MADDARPAQDKDLEVRFFDAHAASGTEYDVFPPETNAKLVDACVTRAGFAPGARVLDLGCGSGVFSRALAARGFRVTGMDLSPGLIEVARQLVGRPEYEVGDAERLPYPDGSFDGVFLAGVIHHFPDPSRMAKEVARVVHRGGAFAAFDPNRRNPFMYLYRVKSSPLYSSKGVAPNEQPVRAETVAAAFGAAGFATGFDYVSVKYAYVASKLARVALPIYNLAEAVMFAPAPFRRFRAFVLSWGVRSA